MSVMIVLPLSYCRWNGEGPTEMNENDRIRTMLSDVLADPIVKSKYATRHRGCRH